MKLEDYVNVTDEKMDGVVYQMLVNNELNEANHVAIHEYMGVHKREMTPETIANAVTISALCMYSFKTKQEAHGAANLAYHLFGRNHCLIMMIALDHDLDFEEFRRTGIESYEEVTISELSPGVKND